MLVLCPTENRSTISIRSGCNALLVGFAVGDAAAIRVPLREHVETCPTIDLTGAS